MISLILMLTTNKLRHTALPVTQDVANHGTLLLRKHQSQLATPLNARQRQLLMLNSKRILIHGIKTISFQTSVLIEIFLILTAITQNLLLIAANQEPDVANNGTVSYTHLTLPTIYSV